MCPSSSPRWKLPQAQPERLGRRGFRASKGSQGRLGLKERPEWLVQPARKVRRGLPGPLVRPAAPGRQVRQGLRGLLARLVPPERRVRLGLPA